MSGWVQVTPSDFPWEREALAHLKQGLPPREPYAAWANFEFLVDGAIGEVDCLVVTPKGIFLVEIKSWPGRLEGDGGTWALTRPEAVRARTFDNPLLLANRKAKRLKGLLARQRAFRGERVPFVAPLVFLSHAELDCRLDDTGRQGVVGLDKEASGQAPQRGGLPGVNTTLFRVSSDEHERLGTRRIDRPTARRFAQALEQAGVRPSQRRRQVGPLELGELLDEGPGYQDFAATHPDFSRVHRRVRIYGTSELATSEQRAKAARAARREFELLAPVSHPGVIRALEFHEHELGPALVFERDPTEQRLDHFLAQAGDALDLGDRLALVRDLAEAVAHAHGRRLFHRALSPRSVLVQRPGTPEQRFAVLNWQTGARAGAGTLASTVEGTRDVEQLIDAETAAYLAPEALSQPDADPELLDVFSVGAIAFRVFSGRPPASSLAALVEVLQRDGALEVAGVLDGAGPYLAEVVRSATAADTTARTGSLRDVLDGLALVEEELTAPDAPQETEVSPHNAKKDDLLAGEFALERRLGRGSTAIAFLVRDPLKQLRVLKVAADPERNERLRDEAAVLGHLRDRNVIAAYGEPVDVAGHTGIVLAYASEGTLAAWLREQGRLGLETLERWGEGLLTAVAYLEQAGIPHRDIKPENLGITEIGPRKRRELVLMDFSLARTPADQIHAGTPPYLDPFLGTPERPRWDLAADRFAAAMVLHEMAAGTLPRWGDGRGDPRFVPDDAQLDRDAFPRELAAGLEAFFVRALKRDAAERFDTADDMLRAWRRLFERLRTADEVERETAVSPVSEATLDTPLAALGLSPRARDVLERRNALTVQDFLAIPTIELNRLRGVGLVTRGELVRAGQELRRRLGTTERADEETATADPPDVQALDALAAQLLPRRTARNATEVDALGRLLGLEPPFAAVEAGWPSQTEVAASLNVTRARVGQVVARARERWRRLPALTRLRTDLLVHLESQGGVVAASEVQGAVAAERGADEPAELPRLARAAVRAAVEVEGALTEPRLAQRRAGGRVLLASAGEAPAERQAVLDWAVRLGDRADELAPALPGLAAATEQLRGLRPPAALAPLAPERLVRLAAAASSTAGLSAQLELHPRDLPPERAVALGRAALLGADALTPNEVRRRIAARFPALAALPERPALDGLLGGAGIDLRFDSEQEQYVVPRRSELTGVTSYGSSLGRLATAGLTRLPPPTDPLVVEARRFEERLEAAIRQGGTLSLMAFPADLAQAGRELRRLPVTPIDLDELLLRQLRQAARDQEVRWDLVLTADGADPHSTAWSNLQRLVALALPAVERELVTTSGTVLLEHPGLLARYGQLGLVDRLRQVTHGREALRGVWLLVAADEQAELPMVEGVPVPVLTPNEWARIPRSWLRNLHRGAEPPLAA